MVLHATPFGRSIYAMGASAEAALVRRHQGQADQDDPVTCVSGLVCALAGVLWTFRLDTAVQDNGLGLELNVVAIVLLAGVSIFGGKGSIIGVVLAVLVFAGLQNALLLTNFNQEATGIVTGALLLASVFLPESPPLARRLRAGACRPGPGATAARGRPARTLATPNPLPPSHRITATSRI